jgi:hypothetical protein
MLHVCGEFNAVESALGDDEGAECVAAKSSAWAVWL